MNLNSHAVVLPAASSLLERRPLLEHTQCWMCRHFLSEAFWWSRRHPWNTNRNLGRVVLSERLLSVHRLLFVHKNKRQAKLRGRKQVRSYHYRFVTSSGHAMVLRQAYQCLIHTVGRIVCSERCFQELYSILAHLGSYIWLPSSVSLFDGKKSLRFTSNRIIAWDLVILGAPKLRINTDSASLVGNLLLNLCVITCLWCTLLSLALMNPLCNNFLLLFQLFFLKVCVDASLLMRCCFPVASAILPVQLPWPFGQNKPADGFLISYFLFTLLVLFDNLHSFLDDVQLICLGNNCCLPTKVQRHRNWKLVWLGDPPKIVQGWPSRICVVLCTALQLRVQGSFFEPYDSIGKSNCAERSFLRAIFAVCSQLWGQWSGGRMLWLQHVSVRF